MARRRFFPSPETESAQQLYQALIVAGVGIAFIGIFSTSYLAITQGIKEPFDAWIAGSIYFWMMTNQPKASSANKDEQDHSNMNYEEAWMKDDDVARHERKAEVEFDCWVSWLAHQSTKHPWIEASVRRLNIETELDWKKIRTSFSTRAVIDGQMPYLNYTNPMITCSQNSLFSA